MNFLSDQEYPIINFFLEMPWLSMKSQCKENNGQDIEGLPESSIDMEKVMILIKFLSSILFTFLRSRKFQSLKESMLLCGFVEQKLSFSAWAIVTSSILLSTLQFWGGYLNLENLHR